MIQTFFQLTKYFFWKSFFWKYDSYSFTLLKQLIKLMAKTEIIDVRHAIMEHLKADDRSLRWLCEKTGINYNTAHSTFSQKVIKLTQEKLDKINEVLGTNFKNAD